MWEKMSETCKQIRDIGYETVLQTDITYKLVHVSMHLYSLTYLVCTSVCMAISLKSIKNKYGTHFTFTNHSLNNYMLKMSKINLPRKYKVTFSFKSYFRMLTIIEKCEYFQFYLIYTVILFGKFTEIRNQYFYIIIFRKQCLLV